MRFITFLMFIAGLAAAYGYPYYHQAFTNFEVGTYTIYDKSNGYDDQTVWLTPDDAPLDISFQAIADNLEVKGGADTAFHVEIKDASSLVIHEETVRFSGPMTDTSSANTVSIEMNVDLEQLPIETGSLYTFAFADSDVNEIPLDKITMRITGNVAPMNASVKPVGYTLLGLGVLMFLFGGRRKNKTVGNAPLGTDSKASRIGRRADPAPPPKPKEPDKPKHKWGRGG